ncbi:MAG: putative mitochondrial protein, conserved [Heterodermia speciosa]|uniref:Succinate dehydrogenase assembly factor 4, mitochondrial n=1 Tax=Heterodermia speciosa TaxID=116794 RepID=A0A8H3IMY7_9LECA|nr:MAG: putative mitochondrial protein, conserved [Heterodermia speciosa]
MRVLMPYSVPSYVSRRLLSTTILTRAATPFPSRPAPPRLPKEDQELYERLQQSSTGAFSTPIPEIVVNPTSNPSSNTSAPQRQRPQINQSPYSTPVEAEEGHEKTQQRGLEELDARVQASGKGEELHPDVRRGSKPEFEGERNPKTGEVGGPKNEPLRWGGGADWSYNGRVTDF